MAGVLSASARCIASNAEVTHEVSGELEAGHGEVDGEACVSEAGDTEAEEGKARAGRPVGVEAGSSAPEGGEASSSLRATARAIAASEVEASGEDTVGHEEPTEVIVGGEELADLSGDGEEGGELIAGGEEGAELIAGVGWRMDGGQEGSDVCSSDSDG